jgi:hypothetical protein
MKIDLYTKAVLTVIAISLAGIAVQLTIKDAHAQSNRFLFTETGALAIAVCNSVLINGQFTCADIVNGGQLRVIER